MPRLVEIKLLLLDEIKLEECTESVGLGLAWKEGLSCFAYLTLDLLPEDAPRWEELKVSQAPNVFLKMILDEVESRVLLDPKISLVKSYDETESRLLETVFKEGEDLVGGLNEDSGSSLRWLANLEEERWEVE